MASTFLEECQEYFDSKDLYEILSIEKDATDSQIKSAYRKKSLKVHPDRATEDRKEYAKKAFQALSKIHYILTTENLRKVYDESGMILTEDDSFASFSTFEEHEQYWRSIFPKITTKQVDNFFEKYIGSDEEVDDLKRIYCQCDGDLDKIYEYHFGYDDEERIVQILTRLIEEEEIPDFDAFSKESKSKKAKRARRIANESVSAEKELQKKASKNKKNSDGDIGDLMMAIRGNSATNFGNMIHDLEAKYSKNETGNKSSKKSRAK